MVKTRAEMEAEEFAAQERRERMHDAAGRIGMTDSGQAFLQRIYEIGRPEPLENLPSQKRKQGE